MKTITTFSVALLLMSVHALAQNIPSCCSMSSTSEFAMLGKASSFKAAHEPPVPFTYSSANGRMVSITCPDGKNANAFEIKSSKTTDNFLFVFQEWWGLNDHIKLEAEKIQAELGNVNVIALDLYDGKTALNADEASKLMQAADEKRIRTIIDGAIAYAGKKAKIQTIGWCFGGSWSLQATLQIDEQAAGCVMYYGMPEKDKQKLAKLNVPLLGIFANYDTFITKEVVDTFEAALRELKKDFTIRRFDADHAFANPSNPKYDEKNTKIAYEASITFLKKNFGL